MNETREESRFFTHSLSPADILRQLNEWRLVSSHCDVVLRIFNRLFPVHGCVVAAASPVLNHCFEKSQPRIFSAAHPQVIDIEIDELNITEEKQNKYILAMRNILSYLYGSNVEHLEDNYDQFQVLMKYFFNEENKEECLKFSKLSSSGNNTKSMSSDSDVCELTSHSQDMQYEKVDKFNLLSQSTNKCNDVLSSTDPRKVPETEEGAEDSIKISVNESMNHSEVISSKEDDLKCPVCSYQCESSARLTSHIALHNDASFSCDKCDFETNKFTTLLQHEKQHSELIKECSETGCSYRAFRQKDLDQHVKKEHRKSKTLFPCHKCDKVCKTKNLLRLHLPIHSEERPYKCDKCPADFRWKNALKKHEIVHTRERNYLCDICGFSAAYRADLNAHSLIHTGNMFKCPVPGCKFRCIKKAFLTTHELTHNPEKLHQCEVCGQKFSLMKNLKRHMRHHTNYRPYMCEFCTYTASRSDKLWEHVQRIHGVAKPPKPVQKHIPDDPETSVSPGGSGVPLPSQERMSRTDGDEATSGAQLSGDQIIVIDKTSVNDVILSINQLMASPSADVN